MKEFVEALKRLESAAHELNNKWSDRIDAGLWVPGHKYPFVGSFDEVCHDITLWRQELETYL
jgi:hypothetical protein